MTSFALSITNFISLGTILTHILIAILGFGLLAKKNSDFKKFVARNALIFSTIITIVATVGSFIYSSVIGFIPCELCWFARIFLISQTVIFITAFSYVFFAKRKLTDTTLFLYSLILSLIGVAITAFHYYGQMFNPEALAACEASGISCSKLYFVSYGYITIPMMALSTFVLLALISLYRLRVSKI